MCDIIEVTDLDAPELDVYARLTENQLLNRADPQNALGAGKRYFYCGKP